MSDLRSYEYMPEMADAKQYWTETLRNASMQLNLPRGSDPFRASRVCDITIVLDESTVTALRSKAASSWGQFVIFVAAAHTVLYGYCEDGRVVTAVPVSQGTGDAEEEWLYIVSRDEGPDTPFRQVVFGLRARFEAALQYQYYPISSLLDNSGRERMTGVIVSSAELHGDNRSVRELADHPYAFALEWAVAGEEASIRLRYTQDVYDASLMRRMLANIAAALKSGLAESAQSVAALRYTSEESAWLRNAAQPAPEEKGAGTLIDRLLQQFDRYGEHTAIYSEDESLTYSRLAGRIRDIAARLGALGIGDGNLVAVSAERSLSTVLSILGIMAAGAAFMPVDSQAPTERIRHMLKESGADLLMLHDDRQAAADDEIPRITIEQLLSEGKPMPSLAASAKADPARRQLAYIIYTSGTTGRPKGVMVSKESLADRLIWRSKEYGLSERDCVLQLFPYYFDGFITSLFTPLLTGSAVVLCSDEEARDPYAIIRLIRLHKVTHFICIPSMFVHLLDLGIGKEHSVNIVTLAGEKLTDAIVNQISGLDFEIANEYGPTEAAVVATCRRNVRHHLSIGKPIRNTEIHILDKNGRRVPRGVIGEICVGGIGLAIGYVNRPELTQARFIAHPDKPDERLYRTGDLGRWTEDGEIEYYGRLDRQVKLVGHRIELDEIEHGMMAASSSIRRAAVVTVSGEDGRSNRLLAYYEGEAAADDIRRYLGTCLPAYMIPDSIVKLDKLPLTPLGKSDYRALERMSPATASAEVLEHASLTPVHRELKELWSDILKKDDVRLDASFFELGGNSIQASILLQRLQSLGYPRLSFRQLYDYPTIAALAGVLETSGESVEHPLPEPAAGEFYNVSAEQKRIYMLETLTDVRTSYNMPGIIKIVGDLDIRRFCDALRKVVQANETLRTSFHLIQGVPMQKIHDTVDVDIAAEDPADSEPGPNEWLAGFVRPFQLDRPPLWRFKLIRLRPDEHMMLFDMHHIIGDDVTLDLLLRQWSACYEDEELQLTPPPADYKTYAAVQSNEWLSGSWADQRAYWESVFADGFPTLDWPGGAARETVHTTEGERVTLNLDAALVDHIQKFAATTNTTLFMILMSVYHILLAKITGQTNIVAGTPVSLRNRHEWQYTMGVFVNTLPIRSQPEGEKAYLDYLAEMKELTLRLLENREVPFDDIVAHVRRTGSGQGNDTLIRTLFAYQEFSIRPVSFGSLVLLPTDHQFVATKFDFMLEAFRTEDGLRLQLDYNPDRFGDRARAEAFVKRFRQLLEHIIRHDGGGRISDMSVLLEEESARLAAYNATRRDYPLQSSIHELFEKQVESTPGQIALVKGNKHMTYKALNERANQLAWRLRTEGCKPNDAVAICAGHDCDLMIGLLGILKAGAAFVPIDPGQSQRISYILRDSGARLILTDRELPDDAIPGTCRPLRLDDPVFLQGRKDNPPPVHCAEDIAYMIYTSGTTGEPKGTMIPHRGLTNYICWANDVYVGDERLDFACYSSISFDLTITSLFTPLIAGNRVLLYDGSNQILAIQEIFAHNQRCIVKLTPSHMKILESLDLSHTRISKLILGGEDLPNALAARIVEASKGSIRIFNEYGPTETVVGCMIYEYVPGETSGSVPIGRPAGNMQIYVLDKELNQVPEQTPGEIYISGVGMAKGYLNKERETNEKFMPNPLAPGMRMYRTGDIARFTENGDLLYLGRADDQIKIRGHRVEPGEIEQVLQQVPHADQVVVLDRKHASGETLLVAFYTASTAEELAQELRLQAERHLPNYMIPVRYVRLEDVPLTYNGKIDRNRLRRMPLPEPSTGVSNLPRNETETLVHAVWMEVLQADRIGLDEPFFEAGGSSLLALQLFDRLHERFPGAIEMTDLFAYPTIRKQAELLDEKQMAGSSALNAVRLLNRSRKAGRLEKIWSLHLDGSDRDKLQTYMAGQEAQTGELIASLCAHGLFSMTEVPVIPLLIHNGRQIRTLRMDMNRYADFDSLLQGVRHTLASSPSSATTELTRTLTPQATGMYVLLDLRPNGIPPAALARKCDLIVTFKQSASSFTISFTYNSYRLSERVETLFQVVADSMRSLLESRLRGGIS